MIVYSFYAMLKYSISNYIFYFVSVFILHHSYSKRIIEKCLILIYQILYTDKKIEVKAEVLMKRYNQVILFASHQLLVTSHQLSVTSYSHQLLVTSCQSLVASLELRNNTSHQFQVNSSSQKYICQGYSREIVGDVLCLLMLILF